MKTATGSQIFGFKPCTTGLCSLETGYILNGCIPRHGRRRLKRLGYISGLRCARNILSHVGARVIGSYRRSLPKDSLTGTATTGALESWSMSAVSDPLLLLNDFNMVEFLQWSINPEKRQKVHTKRRRRSVKSNSPWVKIKRPSTLITTVTILQLDPYLVPWRQFRLTPLRQTIPPPPKPSSKSSGSQDLGETQKGAKSAPPVFWCVQRSLRSENRLSLRRTSPHWGWTFIAFSSIVTVRTNYKFNLQK